MAVVYRHRKLTTGEPFYIGISSRKDRPYRTDGRNKIWKRIVAKHGFTVEIVAEGISKEIALELEQLLIEEYGRRNLGTGPLSNMTNGGEGGTAILVTEEYRAKLSKAKKGIKPSPQCIEASIKAQLGKKMTLEERRKHPNRRPVHQFDLAGNLIKTHPSVSLAGEALNTSHSSISAVCRGKNHSCMGYLFSYTKEGVKERIKQHNEYCPPIIQLTPKGDVVKEYPGGVMQATRETKIFHISNAVKGKRKTAGGYIWKYKEIA